MVKPHQDTNWADVFPDAVPYARLYDQRITDMALIMVPFVVRNDLAALDEYMTRAIVDGPNAAHSWLTGDGWGEPPHLTTPHFERTLKLERHSKLRSYFTRQGIRCSSCPGVSLVN